MPRARRGAADEDVPATAAPTQAEGGAGWGCPRGACPSRARGALPFRKTPDGRRRSDRADALEIVIDPAQAFGTGAHATTRMCLELLLELASERGTRDPLLDVGSGSGVLAIAALKLGYRQVLALDNDRESVRAILANAGCQRRRVGSPLL